MKRLAELDLSHDEFVRKIRSGNLYINVNKNVAGHLFAGPLSLHAGAQSILRALIFGSMILGIVLFFFFGWPALLFVLLGIALVPLAQRHAVKCVEKELISDSGFYEFAMTAPIDLVRLTETD